MTPKLLSSTAPASVILIRMLVIGLGLSLDATLLRLTGR